ncbi:MAG TPA: trypsin-like peptidase domain-containing protein [Blastocatellia bacterium]|jgi:serine protease Do|nr:trypsin-like peptidase domain-containing protein [Blastocatellia bacterium]
MEEINRDTRFEAPLRNQHSEARKQRRAGPWTWIGLTLVIGALVVIVAIVQSKNHNSAMNVPHLDKPVAAVSTGGTEPSPTELSNSFRAVVKSVKDAVVFIRVVETTADDSDQNGPFVFPTPRGPQRREGAGSGFITTEDGYILTNNHVVGNSSKINVTLADGRKFTAKRIGSDPGTDIAVIKIEASGLPVAQLGDSEQVQQGDWVLALGSPFGLQQTLTAGIVSATGRELRDSQFNRYIQTDASINPGNSGGPLVNMQGQVIGINTMILTGSPFNQGNIGIGFAIAVNEARNVFNQLVQGGKVSRGYLGVLVVELDQAKANALGLEPDSGVFVSDVPDANSPAGKAGLRSKDVITAFNGKPVKMPRELTDLVASTPVGSAARVDFIREGQKQAATVTLVERPNDLSAQLVQPGPEGDDDNGTVQQGRLGIQAQTITPEMAERMKLKNPSGVLVVQVQPGSPAADVGLTHGDVIHAIDRAEVKTTEDLAQAVKSLKAGDYMLEIERKGKPLFLTVTLE